MGRIWRYITRSGRALIFESSNFKSLNEVMTGVRSGFGSTELLQYEELIRITE